MIFGSKAQWYEPPKDQIQYWKLWGLVPLVLLVRKSLKNNNFEPKYLRYTKLLSHSSLWRLQQTVSIYHVVRNKTPLQDPKFPNSLRGIKTFRLRRNLFRGISKKNHLRRNSAWGGGGGGVKFYACGAIWFMGVSKIRSLNLTKNVVF